MHAGLRVDSEKTALPRVHVSRLGKENRNALRFYDLADPTRASARFSSCSFGSQKNN